ncbi:MAG: beta-N-acetylglucosaminidase domain-containing protein [Merdibacter sp.]|nr:beta-N-acetylglucosaminidase domain-containing protein [Merdibacter sp.]
MLKKITSLFLLLTLTVSSVFQTNLTVVHASTQKDLVEVIQASASTSYGDANNADKAFDHNSGTRWTSSLSLNETSKNEQYLQAELKEKVKLDRVEITWFTPWVNEYKIQVSEDGQTWQNAAVSSVVRNGNELDTEGAEGLRQKATSDQLNGSMAKYLRIVMNDVDISKGSYLSVVDVAVYAESEMKEEQLSIQKPILHNISSYGQNTEDKMVDGITDSAGNRWTSSNIQMSKQDVLNTSIEFSFETAQDLTRFEVDWFNTPVKQYSISVSESDDGEFTKVVDKKQMPEADATVGVDQLTHTKDEFSSHQKVKRILLTFDDAQDNGYLSICEVRAYGIVDSEENPWEVNLITDDASAQASSVQSAGMEADKAIDGSQSTRWASSFGEQPSYLLIDLKEETSFDQMKMYQEASYGKAFNVEVSTDGENYVKVYETDKGQVGTNDIYFGNEINARYVKINFTEYGLYTAYSVWEVELFKNGAERMFELVSNELSVPDKISSDFKLPVSVKNMDVQWSSSSSLLNIDENGAVSVSVPQTNTEATVTAKLMYGNQEKQIAFDTVILSSDNRQVDYEIYPVPQKETLGETNVDLSETINVVLSDEVKEDTSLIDRINEVFEENGYQLQYSDRKDDQKSNLLIGVNGDQSIADAYADENKISKDVFAETEEKRYDRHLVSLDDQKNIVVLAENADSAYYALATLDLMFESAQSSAFFGSGSKRMTTVLIEDYADMQYRGVIEGFYGWPWSLEDRMSFADFAKRYKLNYFAYGPKSDPYHLSKWNEEYPTNATITEEERELGVMTQEEFKVLIDKFNDSHIDFVWSIHPAMGDNKIDFNDPASISAGQNKIMEKYESMYALGVRQFGLFVDDIDLGVAYTNRVHIADMVDGIQNALYDKWGRAYDDESNEDAVRPLMFVPSHYFLTFGDAAQNEAAIREFARVHEDVIITFTGSGCWSSVVENDAKIFAERAGRDPLFWWNYSTNDVMDDQLFTDKADSYYAMNKDVKSLYGFVSNPMNEAELSKISLFGIADYAWNVEDFDSSRDYDAYFKMEFEDEALAAAYQNVAVNLDKNGKSLTAEKELFNKILNAYKAEGSCEQSDVDQLRKYAQTLKESLQTIEQLKTSSKTAYQNLYDEMVPWLNKLNDMADMILALCDYLADPSQTQEWDLYVSQRLQLDAFKTDDRYAFTSLELNVSNAQSSYLRNVVSPNNPLLQFIEGINETMKGRLDSGKEVSASVITNVDAYRDLTLTQENGSVSLLLEQAKLAQNEYIGIALAKIMHMNLDLSSFEEQGFTVEYSMNGKQWTSEASDFANIRIINRSEDIKTATGEILVRNEKVRAQASTNMTAYDTYTIDKAVDGSLDTKFWKGGNQEKGDQITLEYEKSFMLNDLTFYFDSANGALTDVPETAVVEVSLNGTDWEKIGEIKKADIRPSSQGSYAVTINDIDKTVQYVRYTVETPTGGQWFRVVEIATNENCEKPQAVVDAQGAENVYDGNTTTYVSLGEEKTLAYQVVENLKAKQISILSMPQLNGEVNAEVRVYASKTKYPYHNEWITLGTLKEGSAAFDVSEFYNLEKIEVINHGKTLHLFEIQLEGDLYVDDAKLQYAVDQALLKLDELEKMDLGAYTAVSVKQFNEEILELKNELSAYQDMADVENILKKLEAAEDILVEKGNASDLRSLYEDALKLNADYYTAESYQKLSDVLKEAEALLADIDNADQAKLDAMTDRLNEAVSALQYKAGDYSKVEEAVKKAEGLDRDAYKDFSKVEEAVKSVKYGLDIRYQSDIDQMAENILRAIDALERKDSENEKGDAAIDDPGTAAYNGQLSFVLLSMVSASALAYFYFKKRRDVNQTNGR